MGAKRKDEATNTRIKMIPAPRGFPAESFPSSANSLPASLGSRYLPLSVRIQVPANAIKSPRAATSG